MGESMDDKRRRWWGSEAPQAVAGIASHLNSIGFGAATWGEAGTYVAFVCEAASLQTVIMLSAQSDCKFSTTFIVRSDYVHQQWQALGLNSCSPANGFGVTPDNRGMLSSIFGSLAAACGCAAASTNALFPGSDSLSGQTLREWSALFDLLRPYFVDFFTSEAAVAGFLADDYPDSLTALLKRPPDSIRAVGFEERYLNATLLFKKNRMHSQAQIALARYLDALNEGKTSGKFRASRIDVGMCRFARLTEWLVAN